MCDGFGVLHWTHGVNAGTAAFHAERRWRVLLREVLRLGTGTSVFLHFQHAAPPADAATVMSLNLAQPEYPVGLGHQRRPDLPGPHRGRAGRV